MNILNLKSIKMKPQLKYWRDLPKEEKDNIMLEQNIKEITFKEICLIYENRDKC